MNKHVKALIGVVVVIATVAIALGCYIYNQSTLPPSWICKDGYLWERQPNSQDESVYVRHNRYCVKE